MEHQRKSVLLVGSLLIVLLSLVACSGRTPDGTRLAGVTATATRSRTPAPSPRFTATLTPTSTPTNTPTPTVTETPTPDFCSPAQWKEKVLVLSMVFTALEPGGPGAFDRILVAQNPAWADFRQEVRGEVRSAGVIFHEIAAGAEWGTGVNPAVILVTYGVAYDWALPPGGDLASQVDAIREALYQADLAWSLGRVDRTRYPQIANGPTYALYHYFNADLQKLEAWCRTYVEVYGAPPLKTFEH